MYYFLGYSKYMSSYGERQKKPFCHIVSAGFAKHTDTYKQTNTMEYSCSPHQGCPWCRAGPGRLDGPWLLLGYYWDWSDAPGVGHLEAGPEQWWRSLTRPGETTIKTVNWKRTNQHKRYIYKFVKYRYHLKTFFLVLKLHSSQLKTAIHKYQTTTRVWKQEISANFLISISS